MPERGQRIGLDLDQDLPRHAAVDVDARHAGHVLERLDDRLVGERRELAQARRRRHHGERDDRLLFSLSTRMTSGSLTSRGKLGRTCAILSRTSCIACATFGRSRNSAKTSLRPSREFERIRLTPDTWLTAYSIGLVTSASTASGRGAGIRRHGRSTNGRLTSGICSTLQPLVREDAEHGDRDHHHRREDRVVDRRAGDPHDVMPPRSASARDRVLPTPALVARRVLRRRRRLDERRRAVLQVVEARRQHRRLRGQRRLDLDAAVRRRRGGR